MIRPFIYTLLLLTFLQSCSEPSILPVHTVKLSDNEDFPITQWKLIGPFQSDLPDWERTGPFLRDSVNGQNWIARDNMRGFGFTEDGMILSNFNQLTQYAVDSIFTHPDTFITDFYSPSGYINLDNGVYNTNIPGNAYFACVLESKTEQDVVFLTGGDEGAQLWVNGRLYKSEVQNLYRLVYQNYEFVHLHKGQNLLWLKLPNTIKSTTKSTDNELWRFLLHICTPQRYNDYHLQLERILLQRPIVPLNHPLILDNKPHSIDSVFACEVLHENGSRVLSGRLTDTLSLEGLIPGYYIFRIFTEQQNYEQEFYYGDIHRGIARLITDAKQLLGQSLTPDERLNLEALLLRYNTLQEYYSKENWFEVSSGTDAGVVRKTTQHLVIKPTRVLYVQRPDWVSVSALKMGENPIEDIEFFQLQGNERSLVNVRPEIASDKGGFITCVTDPFLKTIHINFTPDQRPDLIQIVTKNRLADKEMERRYLFIYRSLQNYIDRIEKGKSPLKNAPGVNLRGFRSRIDDQAQYYLVQSPSNLQEDTLKRPLIVFLPWIYHFHVPFMRGPIIAEVFVQEMLDWLITRNDVIAVFPNARTFDHLITAPVTISDVSQTIEEVQKYYNIDPDRIHLFAFCGGSDLALELASKYPSRFASIGIVAGFASQPRNHWEENNCALNFTENLNNLPIYIAHGELDTHTGMESIQAYIDKARAGGSKHIEFHIARQMPFEAYPKIGFQEEVFNFFARQKRSNPREINYATAYHQYSRAYWLDVFPEQSGNRATIKARVDGNRVEVLTEGVYKYLLHSGELPINKDKALVVSTNGRDTTYRPPLSDTLEYIVTPPVDFRYKKNSYTEGPMMDVFRDRFVVVQGSQGSREQREAGVAWTETFLKQWYSSYYVVPEVKNDVDITSDDYRTSNLVLIGNPNNNLVIRKLLHDLPLIITAQGIQVGKREFQGTRLGYGLVYPNPLNPKKYILLLGANSLSGVLPFSSQLAEFGYYDYMVFSDDNGQQYLIDAGQFNEYWQRP